MVGDRKVAVLDACVLYKSVARDLLLRLADARLFIPKWSQAIHDEWTTNLLAKRKDITHSQLQATIRKMDRYFPEAMVPMDAASGKHLLPDKDDVHVLETAIASEASVIVTFNLKDFPAKVLSPLKLTAIHPDLFCYELMKRNQRIAREVFHSQVHDLRRPVISFDHVCSNLIKADMKQSAIFLQQLPNFPDLL